MRSAYLCRLIFGGLLLILSLVSASADTLDDANALIGAGRYDEAIVMLEGAVVSGNAAAELYDTLGRAYHWKKDFDNALKNYRLAAKLDKRFLTSPLPILDHFKLYDEIIQIGEAVLSRGDRDPWILSSLLNAYYDTKNTGEYERVLGILAAQSYSDAYTADYQHYVLAKAEVRAGRHDEAIAYISQMGDKSLLQFMQTAPEFEPIKSDSRFIAMTK